MNKKQTGPKIAKLAARVLDGAKKPTLQQSKQLAASLVAQSKGKTKKW